MTPKFRNIEASILYFNGMYKLPISQLPGFTAEREWQSRRLGVTLTNREAALRRMEDFFKTILRNEVAEHEDIMRKLVEEPTGTELFCITELADLLGDIIIYCMSEMVRFGIPIDDTLRIIMESNFSKLDANGQPIYDESGKLCKGPNYWKPEPRIYEMLCQIIGN